MNHIEAMRQALTAFEQGLGHLARDVLRTAIEAAQPAPAPGYCKHCKQYTIEEPLTAAQPAVQEPVAHTYSSTQATMCACCGEHKHTPLRIDKMGGYVCLTCIDKKLGSLLGEFGHPPAQPAVPEEVMHWDGDDGEDGPHNDIASLLNNMLGNRDLEVGEKIHITRATRLPDVWVCVTRIPEDADVEYEVITAAAPEKGGAA
jgi:hypothetical protein